MAVAGVCPLLAKISYLSHSQERILTFSLFIRGAEGAALEKVDILTLWDTEGAGLSLRESYLTAE